MDPSVLLCIYRIRNTETVTSLVEQGRQLGMTIALWALDKPIPDLSDLTVGTGSGLKTQILNRLWSELSPCVVKQVVVADDDFVFARGSLSQLKSAARYCEFGIAQPARERGSDSSYPFTQRRYLMARQTTFVEPGPVFIVSRPWIDHVFPFPKDFGMGWGLWLIWQDLYKQGCRLGILDCISVKHSRPSVREYSLKSEKERLRKLLHERSLQKSEEGQRTLLKWRVWERAPSWKY